MEIRRIKKFVEYVPTHVGIYYKFFYSDESPLPSIDSTTILFEELGIYTVRLISLLKIPRTHFDTPIFILSFIFDFATNFVPLAHFYQYL